MYPTDNYFKFFKFFRFLKTFLNIYNNIYKSPAITQTCQCIYLKDGWMLAQHWATSWCRRPSVEQTIGAVGRPPRSSISFPHQLGRCSGRQLLMQPGGCFDHAVWDGGYPGQFCWHDNIGLGNKTNFVVFSNFKLFSWCFCILFRSSRIHSFIWSNFLKFSTLKNFHPKELL